MSEKKFDVSWNEGNILLKEEKFVEAALAFEQAIKEGFLNAYTNGDWAILQAAISRASFNDFEISETKYLEFILRNLVLINDESKNLFDLSNDIYIKQNEEFIQAKIKINNKRGHLIKFLNHELPKFSKSYNLTQLKPTRQKNEQKDKEIEPDFTSSLSLNSLIGLDSAKKEVNRLIDFVKIREIRRKRGFEVIPSALHLVFTGNPGTGKTTVARVLASVFKEIGLLEKGHLVEVDRKDLVGKYIGHTAPLVEEKVMQALGGVLFIDEAYALSSNKSSNDFGKEAIDSLVKLMEDYRGQFILIVAGYTDEMQDFLDMNPGLRSRFYKTIDFEDYSIGELEKIFGDVTL